MPSKPISSDTILELSDKVDRLLDAKNYESLELLLKQFLDNKYDFETFFDEAQYYYTVANCMLGIDKTKKIDWFSDDLSQSIIFYRKALNAVKKIQHPTNESINLKSCIETNLGIKLSCQGRIFCCLPLLQSAFKTRNPVSIISLAENEILIAHSIPNPVHKYIHYLTAYELIQLGVAHLDELDPQNKKAYSKNSNLINFKTWFEENYSTEDFKIIEAQKCKAKKIKNKKYLEWCSKNRLFINDLNHINASELVHEDALSLPNFKRKFNNTLLLHEELAYHGNFAELKNDYSYARYLFFKAKHIPNEQVNMFNNTYPHIDDMSYTLTNLKSQHYKSAFKTLYSLFDKIAYFLYRFLDVKSVKKDKHIDFLKLFGYSKGEKWIPRDEFRYSENIFIHALFSILKDIKYVSSLENTGKWLDPDAASFYDIRNTIEHRSLKIVDDLGYEMIQFSKEYNQKNIDKLLDEIKALEVESKNLTKNIALAKKKKNSILELELKSQQSLLLESVQLKEAMLDEQKKLSTHSMLISVSDFESRLMTLMRLARNSIMYLSLAIHFEERNRIDNDALVLPREVPLK